MEQKFKTQTFVNNIRFLCKVKKLNVSEIEVAAGVKPGYLAGCERMNSTPLVSTALAFSELLDTNMERLCLVDIEENMKSRKCGLCVYHRPYDKDKWRCLNAESLKYEEDTVFNDRCDKFHRK